MNEEIPEGDTLNEPTPYQLMLQVVKEPDPRPALTALVQTPAPPEVVTNRIGDIYRVLTDEVAVLEREIEARKVKMATLASRAEMLRDAAEQILRTHGLEGDGFKGIQWRKYAGGIELTDEFNHEQFRAQYPYCYREVTAFKPDVKLIKAKIMELAAGGVNVVGSVLTNERKKLYFKDSL